MSRFTADLTITQMADKFGGYRLWKLHEELVYEIGRKGSGKHIHIPEGFISDGPTIPRFLWAIFPVWGQWGRAGVLHDYACARIAIGKPLPQVTTRRAADGLFFEAMKALNVGRFARTMLYIGVRLGSLFNVRPNSVEYNYALFAKEVQ